MAANAKGLISSSHDISDGGLAVTLVESAFGGQLGVNVDLASLGDLPLNAKLFSESHSRFVVSIRPEDKEAFEALLGDQAYYLGTVTAATQVNIQDKGAAVVDLPVQELLESWSSGLVL